MKNIIKVYVLALAVFISSTPTAYADRDNLLKACANSIELLKLQEDSAIADKRSNTTPDEDSLPFELDDMRTAHNDGYCLGVIEGAIGMNYLYQTMPGAKPIFCRQPKNGDLRSDIKILVKWLKENPDKISKGPILHVAWAFSEAYPCK